MKFFPTKNYCLITGLTEDAIIERLKNNLEPPKLIRFYNWIDDTIERYEGKILDNYFYMNRINYRRGALFTIFGTIRNGLNHREILLKMQYKKSHLIGVYVILGVIGSISLFYLIAQIIEWTFEPLTVIPLLMFVFSLLMYFLKFGGFDAETKKCSEYLKNLFDAQEVTTPI